MKPAYYNFIKNDNPPQGCSEAELKACFEFVSGANWNKLIEFINNPKANRRTWWFGVDEVVIVKRW